MTIALTINGATFNYPETDDVDWGGAATAWASAVTFGMLQKAGGSFVLLSELDFGPGFGVSSLYIKSRSADLAEAGFIRLAQTDSINFRNEANSADLVLGVNSSDQLTFQGEPLQSFLSFIDTATIELVNSSGTVSAAIKNESITDAEISPTAAISVNKLESLPAGNIIVGDYYNVPTSMPVTGDVLLTYTGETYIADGVILDTDINDNAQITVTKIADGSVDNTEFQYLSGVTSSIQTQLNNLSEDITDTAEDLSDHTTASTGVHGVTGAVVGTSDTQTISNKTFSDSAKLTEISTPSTPASGIVNLYAKADGNIYKKASNGVEELVGGGGAPGDSIVNLFINGGMEIWQRDTSIAFSSTSSYAAADRFYVQGGAGTASRSTTVPAANIPYSYSLARTSGTDTYIAQRVEKSMLQPHFGGSLTFSAWVRTSGGETVNVSIDASSTVDTFNSDLSSLSGMTNLGTASEFTVADTWTQISLTINPYFSTSFQFRLHVAGSNPQTLLTTGWMLTPGASMPPTFCRHGADFGAEVRACQRYFEKSYGLEDSVGGVHSGRGQRTETGCLMSPGSGSLWTDIGFKVEKRALPSVTRYSSAGTPNVWNARSSTLADAEMATTVSSLSTGSMSIRVNSLGTSLTNAYMYGQWVADAEL